MKFIIEYFKDRRILNQYIILFNLNLYKNIIN
jgi:hypothetical protein